MQISTNGKNTKIYLGKTKRWFKLTASSYNDLEIEYFPNEKIYVIKRGDGQVFDGSEDIGGLWLGNMVKPIDLVGKIQYKVNFLADLQIEPEANMFIEFDYKFSEDRTKIYIFPVFLENITNIAMNINEDTLCDISFAAGIAKRVRKRIY